MRDTRASIGELFRARRRELRWTLRAVAARVGVDAARISAIENGRSNVTIDMLTAVAEALGLSLVVVPTQHLEEALGLAGKQKSSSRASGVTPTIYDELFVPDDVGEEDQEVTYGGPR